MINIGILGGPYDIHTSMVEWGLAQIGGSRVTTWSWYDYPGSLDATLQIESSNNYSFRIGQELRADSLNSIWFRRPGSPAAHPDVHVADREFVESEAAAFIENSLCFIGNKDTLWINHPIERRHARNKAVQLRTALDVGLLVPSTIFSNNPNEIRSFYNEIPNGIIYKPFLPAEWRMEQNGTERIFILPTTLLSGSDLDDEDVLSTCPGIYQERIKADFEVRATVIGSTVISCKILSQSRGEAIDWRHDLNRGLIPIEHFQLPEQITAMCLELCGRLGLAFGCIDLIVDPNGDIYFLEINESGQFLWKEQALPDLPLLDTFCRLLLRDRDAPSSGIRLEDYIKSERSKTDFQSLERQYVNNVKLLSKWRMYRE